jgi:hypothetical protein
MASTSEGTNLPWLPRTIKTTSNTKAIQVKPPQQLHAYLVPNNKKIDHMFYQSQMKVDTYYDY